MSKCDLLSDEDRATARRQGWLVADVWDGRRLLKQILPVQFIKPYTTAAKFEQWIVNRAIKGDSLATRAIQLVTSTNKAAT